LGISVLDKEPEKKRGKRGTPKKFSLHNFGWNRRLKLGMQEFLLSATREDLRKVGLSNKAFVENKELIVKRAINEGRWESIKGISIQTWLKFAEYIREIQSSKIDTVVTTDIHRLIRMNGTLHGKTGLKKSEFPAKNLQDFDPFIEAVAFKKGKVKVCVSDAPEFRLSGETLGPYKNQTVELPVAAGVMLICKRRAEVAK
jgi:DNA primase small subunit